MKKTLLGLCGNSPFCWLPEAWTVLTKLWKKWQGSFGSFVRRWQLCCYPGILAEVSITFGWQVPVLQYHYSMKKTAAVLGETPVCEDIGEFCEKVTIIVTITVNLGAWLTCHLPLQLWGDKVTHSENPVVWLAVSVSIHHGTLSQLIWHEYNSGLFGTGHWDEYSQRKFPCVRSPCSPSNRRLWPSNHIAGLLVWFW